jgi:hypothetical protein
VPHPLAAGDWCVGPVGQSDLDPDLRWALDRRAIARHQRPLPAAVLTEGQPIGSDLTRALGIHPEQDVSGDRRPVDAGEGEQEGGRVLAVGRDDLPTELEVGDHVVDAGDVRDTRGVDAGALGADQPVLAGLGADAALPTLRPIRRGVVTTTGECCDGGEQQDAPRIVSDGHAHPPVRAVLAP